MLFIRKNGATSNVFRVKLRRSDTGQGLTGLSSASSGLIISTIADNESTATTYTVAGTTIQTITTLGTFAAPSASNCRFKEVDSTNQPGVYEFQFADARFAVSGAKFLKVSVSGATTLLEKEINIQLTSMDIDDGVHGGMSALPNVGSGSAGAILTDGTGTAQLQSSGGIVSADAKKINGVSAGSVTNIAANIGTSQTIVFTGTASGVLVNCNAVDLAGQAISAAAGVTFPATIASPTNITAGTITTVSTVTGLTPSLVATIANQTTILNAVNAITTNTARSAPRVPDFLARPASSSVAYTADLYLYTLQGLLEDADSNTVTVHARNAAGTSLDTGLGSTTMVRQSIGWYRLTYTVNSTDTAQAVYFDFSWTISATAMKDGAATEVQDAENYSFLSAIKTKTDFLPSATAGAAGGVFIAGTNAATSITGALTTSFAGTLTSVSGLIASNLDTTISSRASPTNITAGTITTVTNLTNAPTNGDLTAAMKTSIGTAVAASAVASVTGNVGGKVLGGGATTFSGIGVEADVQTIKAQSLVCPGTVTISPFVGNANAAILVGVDGYAGANLKKWDDSVVATSSDGWPLVGIQGWYDGNNDTVSAIILDAATSTMPFVDVEAWHNQSVTVNGASHLPDVNVGSYAGDNAITTNGSGEPNVNAEASIDPESFLGLQIEGTRTLQDILKLIAAAVAGKVSGGGTSTLTFRDTNDAKDRIIATVDSKKNRLVLDYDLT